MEKKRGRPKKDVGRDGRRKLVKFNGRWYFHTIEKATEFICEKLLRNIDGPSESTVKRFLPRDQYGTEVHSLYSLWDKETIKTMAILDGKGLQTLSEMTNLSERQCWTKVHSGPWKVVWIGGTPYHYSGSFQT